MLNTLDARVKQLMFLCTTLEEKNQELLDRLEENEHKLKGALHENEELNTKYKNLKTAQALSNENIDLKETKARFNKLVREIDKCITLLNE